MSSRAAGKFEPQTTINDCHKAFTMWKRGYEASILTSMDEALEALSDQLDVENTVTAVVHDETQRGVLVIDAEQLADPLAALAENRREFKALKAMEQILTDERLTALLGRLIEAAPVKLTWSEDIASVKPTSDEAVALMGYHHDQLDCRSDCELESVIDRMLTELPGGRPQTLCTALVRMAWEPAKWLYDERGFSQTVYRTAEYGAGAA